MSKAEGWTGLVSKFSPLGLQVVTIFQVHTFLPSLLIELQTRQSTAPPYDLIALSLKYDVSVLNYFSQCCDNI